MATWWTILVTCGHDNHPNFADDLSFVHLFLQRAAPCPQCLFRTLDALVKVLV